MERERTLFTLSWIRFLISRAASALRCARARTSPATTANPRPCSPARAASTAALSARMLVWNAIESMTPMMWLILVELDSICPIVSTTWPITWPPLVATSASDVATKGGQVIRPARVAGALLDRSGDLLDAGGGALQTGCRIFGARRQIQIAGRDIGGCGVDAVAAVADLADDVAQRFGHAGQGIEQLRGLVFAVDPARGR